MNQQIIPPHVWQIVTDIAATAVECSICGARVEPMQSCDHLALSIEDGTLIVTQWTDGSLAVRGLFRAPAQDGGGGESAS